MTTKHPARYSDPLLPVFAQMLRETDCQHIHDPFAGTGRIFELRKNGYTGTITASELEPEWAAMHPETEIANALQLPYPDESFDAIVTSPTYGNRMADHFTPGDGWENARSTRNTYTHAIGRKLHPHNSGAMQWGDEYRAFHRQAWTETRRVIRPGGYLILNISDHIRGGQRQPVTEWHIHTLTALDFSLIRSIPVPTRRQRRGQNGHLRTEEEYVIQFQKGNQ